MKSLSFKGRYVDLILSRKKTSTMRRHDSPMNPKKGDTVNFRVGRYAQPFASATITDVEVIHLTSITDPQARRDGFNNAHELRAQLRETYGPNIRRVALIKFKLIK